MSFCIQESEVMAKEEAQEARSTVVSIRLKPFEAARFWEIEDAVAARNPYVDRADIIRELLGLVPCQALTVAELQYFRTGERVPKLKRTELALAKARPASRARMNKGSKKQKN